VLPLVLPPGAGVPVQLASTVISLGQVASSNEDDSSATTLNNIAQNLLSTARILHSHTLTTARTPTRPLNSESRVLERTRRALLLVRLLRRALRTGNKRCRGVTTGVDPSERDDSQQLGSDTGNNPALRDNNIVEKLVKLFIVANRELQVTRDDPTKKECSKRVASARGVSITRSYMEHTLTSASYCPSQRSPRAQESQRQDTRGQQRGTPVRRRRCAWRTGRASGDDADARRGTRGLRGRNGTGLWTRPHRRCRGRCCRTCWIFLLFLLFLLFLFRAVHGDDRSVQQERSAIRNSEEECTMVLFGVAKGVSRI
jgi:hypothetical protein